MTDAQYEAKFQEMQKYIPFLQKVIEKLKVNNVQQADNPRKAQLQKMEMLHDLLTNKAKKLKMETLMKCEGVLIKLHAKIEKNEDSILNNIKLKASDKPSTSESLSKYKEIEDILGPASPPPEIIRNEEDQPVVIPTERRSSPVMLKEKSTDFHFKSEQHHSRQNPDHRQQHHHGNGQQQQHSSDKHTSDDHFQNIRERVFPIQNQGQRDGISNDKQNHHQHHQHYHHHHNHQNTPKDIRNTNNFQQNPKDLPSPTQHIPTIPKMGQHQISANKANPPATAQMLQTVKVLITEPLPQHIKQQHFASFRNHPTNQNFKPRETICHSNLRTLPLASQHTRIEPAKEVNEAYSPEELWQEYNETSFKPVPHKNTNTVFSRLGDKVSENKAPISISGRYTPIPDVLKSPPLTANDINNLLLESRIDKTPSDVSEVGSRRPQKTYEMPGQRIEPPPTNSLDFIRRKFAQITKLNAPKTERPSSPVLDIQTIEKEAKLSSPLPNERVALKFNPHPRQERLQSMSSNDGSECSNQSRVNDPRLKSKLHLASPLQKTDFVANTNVNVLPSINFKDPRLKLQGSNTVPPTLPGPNFLATYNQATAIPNANPNPYNQATAIPNANPSPLVYAARKDPRISRVPPTLPTTYPAAPVRRLSTTQLHYSSEENWDSEPDETTQVQTIFPRADTPQVKTRIEEEVPPLPRIDPRLISRTVPPTEPPPNQKLTKSEKRALKKKSLEAQQSADLIKAKPPKSDSEENWDSDPETQSEAQPKSQLSINPSLVPSQYKTTNACGKFPADKNITQNQHKNPIPTKMHSKPDSEEDWDSEPEVVNKKPTATKDLPQHFPNNKSPIITQPAGYNKISPNPFASPMQRFVNNHNTTTTIPTPNNTYPLAAAAAAAHFNTNFFTSPDNNNRFSAALNDNSERIKYYEAKKQKTPTPLTYKEFREARERAQAQETARKTAALIEQAKKKAEAEKLLQQKEVIDEHKFKQAETETKKKTTAAESATQKKQTQKPIAPLKTNQVKKDKDSTKSPKAESTLDKMYRTQNFNSKFPKANTTFKIPKKKTEEKSQEEPKNTNDLEKTTTEKLTPKNLQNRITEKSDKSQMNLDNGKSTSQKKMNSINSKNIKQNKNLIKGYDNGKPDNVFTAEPESTKKEETKSQEKKTEEVPTNRTEQRQEDQNTTEIGKNNRDPRCRSKTNTDNKETEKESEIDKTVGKNELSDIVITSFESELTLKPQTHKEGPENSMSLEEKNKKALEKFNKVTQEMSPKPQRILQRRNTMVLFGSAPLVDKEKLFNANALLFEDVQEQEKRKRKQEEEDRQNARRKRNLEEMFQKTDDNCTVSTQNIISGKRRTRTTINFNETLVAQNVFKHICKKDALGSQTTATAAASAKTTKNSSKAKTKTSEFKTKPTYTENDDDEHDEENRSEEIKKEQSETKSSKAGGNREIKVKEDLEEAVPKENTIKPNKKKAVANRKSIKDTKTVSTNPDDEHQNCTDSNITGEAPCDEQPKASSSKSYKIEPDDNDGTSTTANKLNNPTPTPDASIDVLNDIVQQIIKPNADKPHILGLLGQILSEDKLQFIKTIIENTTKEPTAGEENKSKDQLDEDPNKSLTKEEQNDEEEDEPEEEAEAASAPQVKKQGRPKILAYKKKRSELDRLNEDIRDMFICEGVLTATGRRMCTIMGQTTNNNNNDIEPSTKKTHKESWSNEIAAAKRKAIKTNNEKIITPKAAQPMRRSLRSCRTNDEEDQDENEFNDDLSSTTDSNTTDTPPRRKMPLLKPNTPIKLVDEENQTKETTKENPGLNNKRKLIVNKPCPKSKKPKNIQIVEEVDDSKNNSETESEIEANSTEMSEQSNNDKETSQKIRNTNIHWHHQSKYCNWCLVCLKRIPAHTISLHYNSHHGENYISRLAPVLLQKFKQGKLNKPLFGVNKSPKQASWFFRCPFCMKYLNTTLTMWLEHLQNHTAEFRYECSKCHRGSNKAKIIRKHISNQCKGATMVHSAVNLTVPTMIKAHVCHLCNFLQLKRANLERHYLEHHQLNEKNVELLGYTITLFDATNVNCVTEDKATEKENEIRRTIEAEEQVIDIIDDDENTNIKSEITNNKKKKTAEEEPSENTEHEKESQQTEALLQVKKEKTVKQKDIIPKVAALEKNVAIVRKVPDEKNQREKTTKTQIDNNKVEKEQNKSTNNQTDKILQILNSQKVCTVVVVDIEKQKAKSAKFNNITTEKSLAAAKAQQIEKEIVMPVKETQELPATTKITPKTMTKHDTKEKLHRAEEQALIDLVIIEEKEAQVIQDELLVLAAQAAAEQEEQTEQMVVTEDKTERTDDMEKTHNDLLTLASKVSEGEHRNLTTKPTETENITTTTQQVAIGTTLPPDQNTLSPVSHTTISDLISTSIDKIYNRNKRKSTEVQVQHAKKSCLTSNVFMSSRDENNSSPTIQVLAQSIINIEEQATQTETPTDKPVNISIAERLSQRFKDLQDRANIQQNRTATSTITEPLSSTPSAPPPLLPLSSATPSQKPKKPRENPFEKLFNDTVLELEKEKDKFTQSEIPTCNTNDITVISDDEDWEDIEITETAPTPTSTSTNSGNLQKSKNKGLFQKFSMYKGNNTKTKKHIPPLVFMPSKKKGSKDKANSSTTTASSPTPSTTIKATTVCNEKSHHATTINSHNNLGFKPVINIMDDLLPDSPCNDPIDLVPELATFEPLQDLNDVSSILDSNLSVISTTTAVDDHHTSMEDALDFISEQQAQDKQISGSDLPTKTPIHSKTITNIIAHVGYSVQSSPANAFKFYCLLEKCSFLYSSDALGLENHFMLEHSQIKWNGYCIMCQAQCLPNADAAVEHSITKEIKHMLEKHANKQQLDIHTESTQNSTSSSHESEDRPKIKLRRLTGDCLSKANLDNSASLDLASAVGTQASHPLTMLGALLQAKPKPPTKDMPPQPQMPLTEPLLLDKNDVGPSSNTPFKNVSQDFLITSVTSAALHKNDSPLQISSVISLKQPAATAVVEPLATQIPKITNVRTLASKVGSSWSQQITDERQELMESAAESLEVSQILANAGRPSTRREPVRALDDSPGPVVVSETVPVAQAKTGDYVITQTISAQYNENSSAAVGFNISIAASTTSATTSSYQESIPTDVSTPITSRQYKCMASSCRFVSRVPVAMSDHLRFHERRNLSNKRDYFACAFCAYLASSVDDYMKHSDHYHIINKGGLATAIGLNESNDTAISLTKKIQDILNSNKTVNDNGRSSEGGLTQNPNRPEQDSEEDYLKKLRQTIEEIVETTGLPDDKLYRCVVKNCPTKLTEAKFLSHIMFHIGSEGGNPNNYNFKCPHCSAQYHRVAGIKAHIKNHALNRFFCYLCQQTSTNPGQLLKHFSEKHWNTLNMYTKVLLQPKVSNDGAAEILDSGFFVAYTQELSDEDVKKFGEKLILEWQRKKSGSKTHFKSSEIDLLPLVAIFQREVNCGECEYKTKVRTNMLRHLLMHKQNPGLANNSGQSKVASVDPVNPVPCLNSTERFFDKMTNLASSSLITSVNSVPQTTAKSNFTVPFSFVPNAKRLTCGCINCSFIAMSDDVFRQHLSIIHSDNMSFRCTFCQEEVCKKGLAIDRILNHLRFHGATLHRCEECNYLHHMRYVVERHINEKHATLKVNLVTHERQSEDNAEGLTTIIAYTGKKYRDSSDAQQQPQSSISSTTTTRSSNSESSITKSSSNLTKSKAQWTCEVCGHKSLTLGQIQAHSQQQHGSKNQYKCAHCNFGSQQLSQILFHIDEKHSSKTREARCMYRKALNASEDVADTRPLWQRNDPTRVRHIRGILMENEEESEEYQKKLGLSTDVNEEDDDDDAENAKNDNDVIEDDEETIEGDAVSINYLLGYEFSCFHCDFKTQNFNDLKTQHYENVHNARQETAKPFWYQLYRRLCCAICRQFIGNFVELKKHLLYNHNDNRYHAADITNAENDSSHRLLCGYCPFHCATVEQLHRHSLRVQHLQQDLRINSNEHIMDILKLGTSQTSHQCTLCTDIFPNRVAIVQHACSAHTGEDNFSFRELSNSLIYRCFKCTFTSTSETDVLRHMLDHFCRFRECHFCLDRQNGFIAYMQHCYAEHKNDIRRFRELYPIPELQKFLLNILILFPSGLMLSKTHLAKTRYGKTFVIEELYEDIYKISQQPPIPRLLIGRLVARKSIEAQQKQTTTSTSPQTLPNETELMKPLPLPTQAKSISQRRCTLAVSEDDENATIAPHVDINLIQNPAKIAQRRQTVTIEHANTSVIIASGMENNEFNAPVMQPKKICKRRCTVAVDSDTPSNSYLADSQTLLIERDLSTKKCKISSSIDTLLRNTPEPAPPQSYPLNLDVEPFSFYGKTPTAVDISKIFTNVAIGGIQTPLTIEKFKKFFNIDCELKLTKCNQVQTLDYKEYKHIGKACPASHKIRYN